MMETLILISTIVVTLSILIAVYRLNTLLALPTETNKATAGKTIQLMNIAGKWLTVTGGVATFPLVMALIFMPEASANWIATLGVIGCLALLTAAVLLIPACIGQCLVRKVNIKLMLLNTSSGILRKGINLTGYQTIGLFSGVILLALFLPYIADLLTFLVYVAGIVAAGRLGLLDNIEADYSKRNYFGNTDHMKKGADYDFYSGSNTYDSFPD